MKQTDWMARQRVFENDIPQKKEETVSNRMKTFSKLTSMPQCKMCSAESLLLSSPHQGK